MSAQAPTYPDGIEERHAAAVSGWRRHASPSSLVVFGLIVGLALLGVLGHEREWHVESDGTRLSVHMPETIRNGEFLEMRIRATADEPIEQLVIGVDESLWEDITVNTLIPAATEEASEHGEFRFTFAELGAGTQFLMKVDAQVNPDIVGGNEGMVTVYDGDEPLTQLRVAMTVLP